MKRWLVFFVKSLMAVVILLPDATAGYAAARSTGIPLELVKLPPGFKIDIYATGIPNARSMALSPRGILFVGTRKAGNVYAVLDPNGDFRADEVVILANGLNMPNGLASSNGSLKLRRASNPLLHSKKTISNSSSINLNGSIKNWKPPTTASTTKSSAIWA